MATISDVAAKAGVGVGTVSRVLNDSALVSDATRARVLAAIAELDYQPSRSARSLSSGRTQHVGVLVPHFTEPAVAERLRGIVAVLSPSAFDMVLFNVEAAEHARARLVELPRGGQVDGLLIVSLPILAEEGERLRASRLPTVLVDCRSDRIPTIAIDDRAGGALATKHLLGLGHRRIAFVGDPRVTPFGFVASRQREEGWHRAISDAGLSLPVGYTRHGAHARAAAARLATELLRLAEPPTAIVAASDTQALGVLEAAAALGVRVPDDLSVTGFDDIDVAGFAGLTTVRQPLEQSGRRAAELLVAMLGGDAIPAVVDELPLELVVRRTTAPPPVVEPRRASPRKRVPS